MVLDLLSLAFSKYTIPRSYVAFIEEKPHFTTFTKQALLELQFLSDRGIVKTSGVRPILIYEKSELGENVLGRAYPTSFFCIIEVKQGLEAPQLKRVLKHEFFHCFGYNHVDNPEDILYCCDDPRLKSSSIYKYVRELDKKINGESND